ncbi:MAG: DNA gyrase subunit B [Clostridiales bacterium]|jgi:DNA gyrase subunit B|nr:DNA gyrase subunit B [Clostridiales bacterium]
MSENEYKAKDLEVLEGLDAVRVRPGMYIGTTGSKGMHHLLWEIVDNAVDEVVNGFGETVEVTIYEDNSASVFDNGRGIPVDIHPKMKISGVEVVFTQLHAGAKFNNDSYIFSGGLHGVGASVTNALSEWLLVEVHKDGRLYRQEFHSPNIDGKIKSGIKKTEIECVKTTDKKGTYVRFLPDKRVFLDEKFQIEYISKRLREIAFLNKGIKIILTDRRVRPDDEFKVYEYCYVGGLKDFVLFLNDAKEALYSEPIFIEDSTAKFKMSMSFQHTDGYTESVFSYVNNIPTTEGGTHETGFKSALTKVLNDAARKKGYLKEKDANLQGEDFREGITAVLAVSMQNVQFEGQTKTKLGNVEIKALVENLVTVRLEEYFADNMNKPVLDKILQKAIQAARVREASRLAKEVARQKNSINNSNLVGKLAACTGKNASHNELFIVEGDSAGGSAKQGRDRGFQAILPLRGKPLNAEKKRVDQILANDEIRSMISALGTGILEEYDRTDLKYDKVIILADADQDGAHIRSILLTFFFRYMRELITDGHVYIGMPPLYKVARRDSVRYAYDDEELKEIIQEMGKASYQLQRYKGLGEMNPEQLWDTTMDPSKRALMRVNIEDAADAEKIITVLMGDAVEPRKRYIYEYADFNKTTLFDQIK